MYEAVCERSASHNCITDHPGFPAVCLNVFVLETAWSQYKQQYEESFEGPQHKKLRHIAYRQFVRWCWGYLGKNVRVKIPACVLHKIRTTFPNDMTPINLPNLV